MNHINSFFSKIKHVFESKDELNTVVIETIHKVVGIKIDIRNIKIFGDTIYIRENPVVKNEIFFKKNILITELQNTLGKKTIKDLR